MEDKLKIYMEKSQVYQKSISNFFRNWISVGLFFNYDYKTDYLNFLDKKLVSKIFDTVIKILENELKSKKQLELENESLINFSYLEVSQKIDKLWMDIVYKEAYVEEAKKFGMDKKASGFKKELPSLKKQKKILEDKIKKQDEIFEPESDFFDKKFKNKNHIDGLKQLISSLKKGQKLFLSNEFEE